MADPIRAEAAAEIADGVDQSDGAGRSGSRERAGGHGPERPGHRRGSGKSYGKAGNADGDARGKATNNESRAASKRGKCDVVAALAGTIRVRADEDHEDRRGKIGDCR